MSDDTSKGSGRLRRFWEVLRHGDGKPAHVYLCPTCQRPVVGRPGASLTHQKMAGPIHFEPNRAELIARCPVHGHSPWNDPEHTPDGYA